MTVYQVQIDSRRDATYGATIDDISAYVTEMAWNLGMAQSYDEVAPPARLRVTLSNVSGVFNQEGLGSELVTNGSFATWSGGNPASWTVTGESGSDPEVSEVGADKGHGEGGTGLCNLYTSSTTTVSISQTILTVGQRYECRLTVSKVKAGGVVVKNGTTAVSVKFSLPGVKVFTFTAVAPTLVIETSGASDVTIDDVSVKPAAQYYGALKRGTLIRVRANMGDGYDQLYEGRITRVIPALGQYGEKMVRVEAECGMLALLDAEYWPTLQENVRVDEAVAKVFDEAVLPWPYAHRNWMLEVEGCSDLGETTSLYAHGATAFDSCATTLEYVGDNQDRGQGISAQGMIRSLVMAECGGRFFFDGRSGDYTLHSRTRDQLNTTSVYSYTLSDFEQVTTLIADDLVNSAVVSYEPREIGAAGTVLASEDGLPMEIKPGQMEKIVLRYRDVNMPEATVGGKSFIVPLQAGVDYIVNSAEDGTGANETDRLTVSVEPKANSAIIYAANGTEHSLWVTTLQIRGTPIKRWQKKQVQAVNHTSERDYERVEKTYDITAIADAELARQYAEFLVNKFGAPAQRIASVTLRADDSSLLLPSALGLTVGSRITITDSASGHNSDYFIVGEQHQHLAGGRERHITNWTLKPASRELLWLVGISGRSELDVTTRMGF